MDGQLLSDLKVADLRRELEKRQKDKSGVKQVLIDRLREALEEDGHDPLTFRFGNDVEVLGELDSTDHLSINGDVDAGGYSKDPIPEEHSEVITDELTEPKKLAEESVPYVVQVGDQEEDLDYDLKADNEQQTEITEDRKSSDPDVSHPESGKSGKTVNEAHRNIWVSNLPKTVKAADLKQHFSKAGKVLSATVVMSTKSPGGCFGFLQMGTSEDATNAAHKFNGTEYNGHKLSVEATDRKPPALAPKPVERSAGSRSKGNAPKRDQRRPFRRGSGRLASRRRPYGALRRNLMRRAAQRPIGVPSYARTFRPPRLNPSVLAYQSLKRASRLLAASRYGMVKGLQQAMEHPLSRYRMLRDPVVLPRSAMRYGAEMAVPFRRQLQPERREPRRPVRPESPIRRSDPRPVSLSDRRRPLDPSYYVERSPRMVPPRRSDPVSRHAEPPSRSRAIPPLSPFERRRLSQPTSAPRTLDMGSRYERDIRAERYISDDREFARPDPARGRPEPRSIERMESMRSARMLPNGSRHMTPPQTSSFDYARFKPMSEMPIPQRSPTRPQMSSSKDFSMFRREYRDISRSPPRSRATPVSRQYVEFSQPRFDRDSRDRSPMRSPMSNVRPKVVDYGHRSEPRTNWSPYRNEGPSIQAPPGHTWKPAGHTMVSNYGSRGSGRRYM